MVEYLEAHQGQLDADSQRRLHSNPLRILDTKNPDMQALVEAAPKLFDYLGDESKDHFAGLCAYLESVGIDYTVNHRLVRGLDYYSKTVFEWVTDKLGAQGTVCAGGRFDVLIEHLGGKPTFAAGFAVGVERIVALLEEMTEGQIVAPHAYLIVAGDAATRQGVALAEQLRDQIQGLRLIMHCGGGSFKSQMKKADKSGAQFALILGDDKMAQQTVTMKDLRGETTQQTVSQDGIDSILASYI